MIKIDLKEFEELVKKLDKNKYHICRELGFDTDNTPYIRNWDIFRKDMSLDDFLDKNNVAVLSSIRGNTIEDLKELVRKENNNEKI